MTPPANAVVSSDRFWV